MAAQIRVLAGPDRDRVFPLADTGSARIGRGKEAGILIHDPTVSRTHCELIAEGDQITVADAGSSGGTFVNGAKITRRILQHGDLVQIGETQFRFESGAQEEEPTLMANPARLAALKNSPAAPSPEAETGTPGVKKFKPGPGPRPPQLAPEQLHELAGQQISHYWLGQPIARGSTGVVFQAQDIKHNRPAALKVLWPDFVREPAGVKRLIRSMRTMLPLTHPHLVSVYTAGRTGPYCWVAMEYVEGESAAHLVERSAAQDVPDWPLVLRVAVHICRALAFAHYHHILHRNITPTNILITATERRGKLGDLMFAKALDGKLAEQLTAPGTIVGSNVFYMSPEGVSPQSNPVDERSDLYSLGATLYAMLTGQPPVHGQNIMETLAKIWQEVPAPAAALKPSIPPELGQTVMRLLAKNPAHRPQKAAELLGEFNQLARALGVAL